MSFFERQQSARQRSSFFVLQFILLAIPCILGMYVATMVSVSVLVNGFLAKLSLIDDLQGRNLGVFWLTSSAFYTVIVLWVMVARKRHELGRADDYVAAMIHARRVTARSGEFKQRQLWNVVEEMSLASGIVSPSVYVWDADGAVNALTIGKTEADAAMFISRGALDVLTRDEMQALVGYGMSQILNGDMALNVKLASYVYAFKFAPRITNFFLFFPSGQKGVKFLEGVFAWLFLYLWVGLLLSVVTYPQWFAAKLLQMSVGRERQRLADASALQFTRNPEAVKGLFLKAIAFGTVTFDRSKLLEDLAHACFAAPQGKYGLMLPHRPLEKRLRTHDPRFDAARLPELIREIVREVDRRQQADMTERVAAAQRAEQFAAQHRLLAKIGGFVPAVASVAESVDALIALGASGDPRAVLIALLLDADQKTRHQQLAAVRAQFGDESMVALAQSVRALRPLTAAERTLALDSHLPAVRDLSRAELERLASTLRALEAVDASVDLFEYAITRRTRVFIRDVLEPRVPHGKRQLGDFPDDLALVFSVIATHSAPGTSLQAYEKGMRRLGMEFDRAYQPTALWGQALDAALDRLEKLKPVAKELMLEGLQATMQFDQHESAEERELLRVVATSLHCPMPR